MTNFFKMTQAIADLGYDVYIFKRFADGGRGDFIYQLSKIKTVFIVSPSTGRVYTCSHNCFLFDASDFQFGAIEYSPTKEQVQYGWEGYWYPFQENGDLDTTDLKDALDEFFSDMEEAYSEDRTDSILYKAESLTERDIARLGYRLGFRYKYRIYPTAFTRKGFAMSGTGYGYRISAQEYYAEMRRQNPNLKIVVVDPMDEYQQIQKIVRLSNDATGLIEPFSVENSKQW